MTDIKNKDLPVILVGQQQRCGGSLITKMFDSHPNLHVHPSENYFGRPYKYHWPTISPKDPLTSLWKKLCEYPLKHMSETGKISKGNHNMYRFTYSFSQHTAKFIEHLGKGEKNERKVIQAYLQSLFDSYLNYKHPKEPLFYAYFTPRQCLYAEEFFRVFPDGHVIQIIRHPAAFYNSVRFHNRYYDIQGVKFLWRLYFFQALFSRVNGWNNYHVIDFKQLVDAPENTLKDLCGKLKITFNKSLLQPTFNGERWGGDSHFETLDGVDKNTVDHYKKHLSNQEINYFNEEAEWYEEFFSLSNPHTGFLNKFKDTLDSFSKYLKVYKKEKPVNNFGMTFSDPSINSDLLGCPFNQPLDYFRLMSQSETKVFHVQKEIWPDEEVANLPVSVEIFDELEDTTAIANALISFWMLQGSAGLVEVIKRLSEKNLNLKEVLENIHTQIKRDLRLITLNFPKDLEEAIKSCAGNEFYEVTDIRRLILKARTTAIANHLWWKIMLRFSNSAKRIFT
jgi:hypothetical protein